MRDACELIRPPVSWQKTYQLQYNGLDAFLVSIDAVELVDVVERLVHLGVWLIAGPEYLALFVNRKRVCICNDGNQQALCDAWLPSP